MKKTTDEIPHNLLLTFKHTLWLRSAAAASIRISQFFSSFSVFLVLFSFRFLYVCFLLLCARIFM